MKKRNPFSQCPPSILFHKKTKQEIAPIFDSKIERFTLQRHKSWSLYRLSRGGCTSTVRMQHSSTPKGEPKSDGRVPPGADGQAASQSDDSGKKTLSNRARLGMHLNFLHSIEPNPSRWDSPQSHFYPAKQISSES